MSESTTIAIYELPGRATEELLRMLFGDCGKIVELILSPDVNNQELKRCQITFEKPEEATKALVMNDKKIIGKTVRVELLPLFQEEFVNQEWDMETVGEVVYPLALEFDPRYAGKLTGMLVDALLRLQDQIDLYEVLSSPDYVWDLLQSAYMKLNVPNEPAQE